MAVIELSMVVGAIVEMGVEAVWDKAKRREAVIKVLRKAGLKTDAPPSDFDGIYAYTLVEYGIWKPRPVLDFFRHEFIRNAFRQSFEARDPAVLQTEAESLIEWHRVGEDLKQLDVDPRHEFARFTAVFNEIVDRTRTPADVRRDQKLDDIYGDLHLKADDILQRLEKLTELEGIRQELSRLTESYRARQFVMVPNGDKLKVFISSKMGELRDVRDIVTESLQARGIDAWVYEARGGARPDDVVHASLSEVEAADIYVGLFWQEYGEVTAKEYQHARALRKPCFVYIRDGSLTRDGALEEFLRTDVYDLRTGVCYDYFDSASKLGSQAGDDIMAWLVRQHREMSAAIQAAQVSVTEIERLQAEVDRLQAVSRNPLPDGTPMDYLASQMRAWFETLGYRFESYSVHAESHFEWIIDVPARRGYDRVLVRGVNGEADLGDVQALRQVIDAQHCDEGWLVAPRRVSQLARNEVAGEANRDLLCYTFDELLDETADFTAYFQWLESEVKRQAIDRMYVPLACTKSEYDKVTAQRIGESRYGESNGWIDGYLDRWLDDASKEHISILGEFGTGKTWFALHYAWITLERYRAAKERGVERPRLPIVVPLRDYAKAVSVESLFSEFFFRKHEVSLSGYSAFEQLNRMGKLLLIFDGFDEMAAKVDRQSMINNFWQLAKVVVPGSKAILTCRSEHFPEAIESRALLGAKLPASSASMVGKSPQFEVIELEKLDDRQIKQVLSLRATPSTVDRVMIDSQLLDMARRAVMIEYLLEALPDIELGRPIDVSRIYLYAVQRKLERDIKAERTFTSLADKIYFLAELSWEMLSSDQMSLNYRHFSDRIRRLFGSAVQEQKDLDHWQYDMMGQTLLIRNADGDYFPAHRSLLEFFVAYKLAAELGVLADDFVNAARLQSHVDKGAASEDYTWSSYFQRQLDKAGIVKLIRPLGKFIPEDCEKLAQTVGQRPLSKSIVELMKNMLSRDIGETNSRLYSIIRATRSNNTERGSALGGNSATLLLSRDPAFLKGKDLGGVELNWADLGMADLSGVNLQSASLRAARFYGTVLTKADLRRSDLSNAEFHDMGVVRSVAFSHGGGQLCSGGDDKDVHIWDVATGTEVCILKGHSDAVTCVCWSSDDRLVVSGSRDGYVVLWDPSTREAIARFRLGTAIETICLGEEPKVIAVKTVDQRTVQFVRIDESQRNLNEQFGIRIIRYNSVAYFDGEVLISCLTDERLTAPKMNRNNTILHLIHVKRIIGNVVNSFQFEGSQILDAHHGNGLIALTRDSSTLVINCRDANSWPPVLTLPGVVSSLAMCPSGSIIAAGFPSGTISLWDLRPFTPSFGRCLQTIERKLECRGLLLHGAHGLDASAPDSKGTLGQWLETRGAIN